MAKKCASNFFCIENMTFFVAIIICMILAYLTVEYIKVTSSHSNSPNNYTISSPPVATYSLAGGVSTRYNDPINDPYSPPLKVSGTVFPNVPLTSGADIFGLPAPVTTCGTFGCQTSIPVNVQTNAVNMAYTQIGILTKDGTHSEKILPLMGRSLWNRRDKWQYYTMANTAASAINTKLPVKVKGKSCTSEYGCDEIYTGDEVYVEGMNDTLRATIYENAALAYLPVI